MADEIKIEGLTLGHKVGAGGAVIAALAMATSLVAPWEGKRNDPYRDVVGVQTVCYGETRVQMRRYSDAECKALLTKAIEKDFAPKVFACVPVLKTRPFEAAASISLAYNIGPAAFCKSTAARRFRSNDWSGGCNAMNRFVYAGGRVVQGLVNRRRAEVALCMKGVKNASQG